MSEKRLVLAFVIGLVLLSSGAETSQAQDFDIALEGFQEVPPISTSGSGGFLLSNSAPFGYELDYDLEGEIVQAHIHFGQAGANGGIMIWLCANPAFVPGVIVPPVGTPDCQGTSGSVVSELMGVIGSSAQGIAPGEGAEALAAIRAGVAYVNVHSDLFPAGEIRGQLIRPNLSEDLEELRESFEDHTHTYLTGRGRGHNNSESSTSEPD